MLLTRTLPWLLAAAVASAAAMAWAAHESNGACTLAAATLFGEGLVIVGWSANRSWHDQEAHGQGAIDLPSATIGNARLMAIAYLWGGLAMLAVYLLSGLIWRHGWQYGNGMILIAVLIVAGIRAIVGSTAARHSATGIRVATLLALTQAIGAVIGLTFLVASGKLSSAKGEWAANYIFLVGGLTLIALTMIALRTQMRLKGYQLSNGRR